MTHAQADEILKELKSIRMLLQSQQRLPTSKPLANAPAEFNVRNVRYLGSENAPLTIIEFSDFECRFCQKFYSDTFIQLKKNYIDSGKVKYYTVDVPSRYTAMHFRQASIGANATPSFLIRKGAPETVTGELVVGLKSYKFFSEKLAQPSE